MSLLSPVLMLTSLVLLSAGFALLLYRAAEDEAHEPSPADLSTSRPVPRPWWSRVRTRWQARAQPRARRTSVTPREIVFEMVDTPSRTLLAGCIADL
jgi:hypothetical protein